ncbi:MAG TPA: NAD(P)/FAD-dependent oxidoreductase [Steroidobacteraceae bacterium]|nr:NAD(P)/FAD-dependent oxidoreductase [Steroidobacteraceae bacterium]
MNSNAELAIVGAGPAGTLLALLAARRGIQVALFERRADPRSSAPAAGRSINLALAARGMRALDAAGMLPALRPLLVPMHGRQLHLADGGESFSAYGQMAGETNYAISRVDLARLLVEAAGQEPRIRLHFRRRCVGFAASGRVLLQDEDTGQHHELDTPRVIGADGAGSALRKAMAQAGEVAASNELLDHDYKELAIPAVNGASALAVREALHIWPRRGCMLIALPNADHSFTATLFLPRTGAPSFAALARPEDARGFFAREFPDALARMPDFDREIAAHPQGVLGTVRCAPWNLGERLLLIGDAAHAIVPFHGQGMNCALEDCVLLDALLADGRPGPFARFSAARRADTDAIAAMSLENYGEMRAAVLDPRFQRQRELELQLERRHPRRFVPRYAMVMFHPEIPYSMALQRGRVQQQILDELEQYGAPDSLLADRLVRERLDELP